MSRTIRSTKHHRYSLAPSNQELSWIGIGDYHYEPLVKGRGWGRLYSGCDGVTQSRLTEGYNNGWPELYEGKTRKFVKRRYAKAIRQHGKVIIMEWEE